MWCFAFGVNPHTNSSQINQLVDFPDFNRFVLISNFNRFILKSFLLGFCKCLNVILEPPTTYLNLSMLLFTQQQKKLHLLSPHFSKIPRGSFWAAVLRLVSMHSQLWLVTASEPRVWNDHQRFLWAGEIVLVSRAGRHYTNVLHRYVWKLHLKDLKPKGLVRAVS